jgi:hypothetical protein
MDQPHLNPAVLDGDKRRVIQLHARVVQEGRFFLAGGTGLGLHPGHRLSEDLDWFTPTRFDAKELMKSISRLPEKPTLLRQDGRHTVRAYYNELGTADMQGFQIADANVLEVTRGWIRWLPRRYSSLD